MGMWVLTHALVAKQFLDDQQSFGVTIKWYNITEIIIFLSVYNNCAYYKF